MIRMGRQKCPPDADGLVIFLLREQELAEQIAGLGKLIRMSRRPWIPSAAAGS